jgi:hypothetical protein
MLACLPQVGLPAALMLRLLFGWTSGFALASLVAPDWVSKCCRKPTICSKSHFSGRVPACNLLFVKKFLDSAMREGMYVQPTSAISLL